MNRTETFRRPVFTAVIFYFFSVLAFTTVANARISEPHHTLYGLLPDDTTSITLKIDGEQVSTYTRGDNPAAGEYFILTVPLDSLDPPLPGTYRAGSVAELYLDAETWPVKELFVGWRGTVQLADLNVSAPPVAPGDGDEPADPSEDGDTVVDTTDTDGDGYTDLEEAENFNNGILDPDGNGFDPFVTNAPGGVGYTEPPTLPAAVLLLLLQTS